MQLLLKLIFRESCAHWVRLSLAILSVVATSCLVTWTIGGYDQMSQDVQQNAHNFLGQYDLVLEFNASPTPLDKLFPVMEQALNPPPGAKTDAPDLSASSKGGSETGPAKKTTEEKPVSHPESDIAAKPFNQKWIQDFRADSDVARADLAQRLWVRMIPQMSNPKSEDILRERVRMLPRLVPIIALDVFDAPFKVKEGVWYAKPADSYSETTEQPREIKPVSGVIGTGLAQQMEMFFDLIGETTIPPVKTGSRLKSIVSDQAIEIEIVGVIEQGNAMSGGAPVPGHGPRPGHNFGGNSRMAPDDSSRSETKGNIKEPFQTDAPYQNRPRNRRSDYGFQSASFLQSSLYVPARTVEKLEKRPFHPQFIYVRLNSPQQIDRFTQRWQKIIDDNNLAARLITRADVQQKLSVNQTSSTVVEQAQASLAVTMLTAIFIIFTTLCMGVNERSFQLAMLRCIGLSKRQVAALIFGEAILLGVIGWLGGLLAGWGLLILDHWLTEQSVVVWLSYSTVWLTGVCALAGALLAAIIPAIRAARIKPMDALKQTRKIPSRKPVLPLAAFGALLLAINPWIVFSWQADERIRIIAYSIYGCISMTIGFVLLAPLIITVVEYFCSGPMAWLLGMRSLFLRQQLSRNIWRSAGTVISVSVGLALYTSIQIWGYSLLVPFSPKQDYPHTLVNFRSVRLADSDIERLEQYVNIVPGTFFPLSVEQPRFSDRFMKEKAAEQRRIVQTEKEKFPPNANTINPNIPEALPFSPSEMVDSLNNNIIVIGLDAVRAFGSGTDAPSPFQLEFVEGSAQAASKLFQNARPANLTGKSVQDVQKDEQDKSNALEEKKNGSGKRYCIVTEDSAFHLGQTIEVAKPKPEDRNWGRFALEKYKPQNMLRELNPLNWFGNQKKPADETIQYEVAGVVRWPGCQTLIVLSGLRIRKGLGGLMLTDGDQVRADYGLNDWQFFWFNVKPGTQYVQTESFVTQLAESKLPLDRSDRSVDVRVTTSDSIRDFLDLIANKIILSFSRMPLIILLITTIAVLNTVVASVRTRRWEIGLLRAVGVDRFQLVRLILAETVLLGLCACVLSLSFGFFCAWCSLGLLNHSLVGLMQIPLVVPSRQLGCGLGITLGLCAIVAVWVGWRISRESPSDLLKQTGE